jgi:hypothetical protein
VQLAIQIVRPTQFTKFEVHVRADLDCILFPKDMTLHPLAWRRKTPLPDKFKSLVKKYFFAPH